MKFSVIISLLSFSLISHAQEKKKLLPHIIESKEFKSTYTYDNNENIIDHKGPAVELEYEINRYTSALDYTDISYDNKNGIFSNVDLEPFSLLYDPDARFPYFYFLSNNIIRMTHRKKGTVVDYTYKYNTDGYPVQITGLPGYDGDTVSITYIPSR